MVFSSIVFLCFFLPITVLLYYTVPRKFRNLILLLVSLLFYAWGEPIYILIMIFSTVFDYTNGRLLEKYDDQENIRKLILIMSVVVNIGILCFFKYTDFVITNINTVFQSQISLLKLSLPIGISFYTFQTLSYTIDVYRRKVDVQHSMIDFGMYICLFPQLIAGPIVRYADIEKQIKVRDENSNNFWNGLIRFSIGLGKKVLLANQIGMLWDEISATPSLPLLTAWLGILAYSFQIYFDFSGYSDMAIGLGMLFGFRFPENFRYPYESKSITEFWRRWHITLSTWFREYVYIPLGGNRKGIYRQIINLFVVWILTGFWHGAGWNFVLWGFYYFVLLVVEKFVLKDLLTRLPTLIQHIYSIFFIMLGWMIFAIDNIKDTGMYLLSLFGKNGLCNSMSMYYLATYAIIFVILIVGCTEIPGYLANKIRDKIQSEKLKYFLEVIFVVGVISLSFIFLVGDSYNPFLYFRF